MISQCARPDASANVGWMALYSTLCVVSRRLFDRRRKPTINKPDVMRLNLDRQGLPLATSFMISALFRRCETVQRTENSEENQKFFIRGHLSCMFLLEIVLD